MKDVKKTKVVLTLQRIQTGIVLSVNVFQNQNWTKRLIFISINQPQAWTLTSKGIFFFLLFLKDDCLDSVSIASTDDVINCMQKYD